LHSPRRVVGSAYVEFASLTLLAILFVLLPVGNLFAFLAGAGLCNTATDVMTHQAAVSTSFNNALNAMVATSQQATSAQWANFLKIAPSAGYEGSGADLFVTETNSFTGASKTYSADTMPLVIDTSTNIYECAVKSNYAIGPVFSLAIPMFAGIPGLGAPLQVTFSSIKPAEHITDWMPPPSVALGWGASSMMPAVGPPLGPTVSWNYPFVISDEALPGDSTVTSVSGLNISPSSMTDTGIAVTAGQRVSIIFPKRVTGPSNALRVADTTFDEEALSARIGSNATFYAGSRFLDVTVAQTGELYLEDNVQTGSAQTDASQVNIIVTN
jgi:hypothetical protein